MRSLSNGFSAEKKNILNGRQLAKDVEYSGIWCIHQQWSLHSPFLHLDRGSKYVRSWSRQHLELSYSICNISAEQSLKRPGCCSQRSKFHLESIELIEHDDLFIKQREWHIEQD